MLKARRLTRVAELFSCGRPGAHASGSAQERVRCSRPFLPEPARKPTEDTPLVSGRTQVVSEQVHIFLSTLSLGKTSRRFRGNCGYFLRAHREAPKRRRSGTGNLPGPPGHWPGGRGRTPNLERATEKVRPSFRSARQVAARAGLVARATPGTPDERTVRCAVGWPGPSRRDADGGGRDGRAPLGNGADPLVLARAADFEV